MVLLPHPNGAAANQMVLQLTKWCVARTLPMRACHACSPAVPDC